MNKVWEFGVSSTRLAVVAGCLALAIVVAGGAGFAAGVLLAPQFAPAKPVLATSKAKQAAPKVPVPQPEPPAAAKPVAAEASAPRPAENKPATKEAAAAAVPVARQVPPIQLDVQVGSFSDEKNAQSTVDRLKRSGYPAFAFLWTDASSRSWHVVQVGPYAAYDTASGVVMELTTRYNMDPFIIPAKSF
jgi:cell division septation protein DedD